MLVGRAATCVPTDVRPPTLHHPPSSLQGLPYDPDTETWGLASLGALLTQFLRLFVLSTALGLAVGLASAALAR